MARRIELVVTRTNLHDPDTDVQYWLTRPVAERIGALTELRQTLFELGDDAARDRLQRVHRVLERTSASAKWD